MEAQPLAAACADPHAAVKNSIARRRGWILMAYKISDDCIACGTCAGVCPVSAISEGDGKYVIDADACLDCGTCAGECPVSAISEG